MPSDPAGAVTALLQQMIRASCVNEGTLGSGHEERNAATLRELFEGAGLGVETYTAAPGRESVITRIEGSDPTAPRLMLMGHLDVVPVTPESWKHDPFGGELIDQWVWGRGAVDMLNITSSMAVAVARLARSNFKPRGTLIFLGVADEEAGGQYGARWLAESHWDAIDCDYVLTESGGVPFAAPGGMRLWTSVAEKGVSWRRITVRGVPEHASRPLYTSNAVVAAAEIARRLAEFRPRPVMTSSWKQFVAGMGFDEQLSSTLTDPDHIWEGISELPVTLAKTAHACTHVTAAPTVIHGGNKTNIIPDKVVLEVDIRKLPGQGPGDVEEFLKQALGDMFALVEIEPIQEDIASESPVETPLWDSMARAAAKLRPDATLLPGVLTGSTDARVWRERGIPAYGFGLFSKQMTFELWSSMFHGNNERVDVESLRLSTELWEALAHDFLS